MKIEKINDNEIRIIFNILYLEENNLSLHTFMSNSIESQQFLVDLLLKAQNEVGFKADDSDLTIQTLFMDNGNFVINVTKNLEESVSKAKVLPKKKNSFTNYYIYKFSNSNDFNDFLKIIKDHSLIQEYSIYSFQNSIYISFEKNVDCSKNDFFYILSEFAIKISNSELLINKLKECGMQLK